MADAKEKTQAAEERAATDELQKVEAPVVPAPAVEGEKVTIVLNTTFKTNGVAYGPGRVEVSREVADDLIGRQEYWDKVEKFRLTAGDYTVKEAIASFDAAGK